MTKENLDKFEKTLFEVLEDPFLRWKLKDLIQRYDNVDFAKVNLMLKELELEIKNKKGGMHE